MDPIQGLIKWRKFNYLDIRWLLSSNYDFGFNSWLNQTMISGLSVTQYLWKTNKTIFCWMTTTSVFWFTSDTSTQWYPVIFDENWSPLQLVINFWSESVGEMKNTFFSYKCQKQIGFICINISMDTLKPVYHRFETSIWEYILNK